MSNLKQIAGHIAQAHENLMETELFDFLDGKIENLPKDKSKIRKFLDEKKLDFIHESDGDTSTLGKFEEKHIVKIVKLLEEVPVSELITAYLQTKFKDLPKDIIEAKKELIKQGHTFSHEITKKENKHGGVDDVQVVKLFKIQDETSFTFDCAFTNSDGVVKRKE